MLRVFSALAGLSEYAESVNFENRFMVCRGSQFKESLWKSLFSLYSNALISL